MGNQQRCKGTLLCLVKSGYLCCVSWGFTPVRGSVVAVFEETVELARDVGFQATPNLALTLLLPPVRLRLPFLHIPFRPRIMLHPHQHDVMQRPIQPTIPRPVEPIPRDLTTTGRDRSSPSQHRKRPTTTNPTRMRPRTQHRRRHNRTHPVHIQQRRLPRLHHRLDLLLQLRSLGLQRLDPLGQPAQHPRHRRRIRIPGLTDPQHRRPINHRRRRRLDPHPIPQHLRRRHRQPKQLPSPISSTLHRRRPHRQQRRQPIPPRPTTRHPQLRARQRLPRRPHRINLITLSTMTTLHPLRPIKLNHVLHQIITQQIPTQPRPVRRGPLHRPKPRRRIPIGKHHQPREPMNIRAHPHLTQHRTRTRIHRRSSMLMHMSVNADHHLDQLPQIRHTSHVFSPFQ